MKFLKYFFIFVFACIILGAASIYGMYKYVEPQLPDVATLKDVRLQTPMQVFSADGELMAQYGEKRRLPLTLQEMPPQLINAFIATEDTRFREHHGID
ncbi:transglycosylase domain-containing protein, partial [Proteus mirabilis]